MQGRVLLVEDDGELREVVATALRGEGYLVDEAVDGQRGLHLGLTRPYDVMLIDRKLPALDGLDLLARLQSRAVTARTLMLAPGGTVTERIEGLDAGADDYLVKPFHLGELSARVRALRRRASDGADALPIGRGFLDLVRRDAVLADGTRVTLSTREFTLLKLLASQPNTVHSRTQLRSRVFDEATAASIIDTYVYYLRRKLDRNVVKTVHGLGYRLGSL
ncbi:response regulator transcription factor [Phycicoccus sp. CSK15P-2]|nr:response regulator transcription factor [Phycicoccus sp. CSK15P-2]